MNLKTFKLHFAVILSFFVMLSSCNQSKVTHIILENTDFGNLSASKSIEVVDSCSLSLDSCSAPKPIYIELLEKDDSIYMSFLNHYTNNIYTYNLVDGGLKSVINLVPNNTRILKRPIAFTFLDDNSVGVLDATLMQFIRIGLPSGKVISRFDLKDIHNSKWPDYYPQYNISTANHMWNISNKIYIPGQYFRSMPQENIDKCKLMSVINLEDGTVSFRYNYPTKVYGNNANWEGGSQTEMYATLGHDENIILSYPPSHEIFIPETDSIRTFNAASTFVKNISSINYEDWNSTPEKLILENYLHQYMYGPLIYDRYNDIYYRFLNWPIDKIKNSNDASDRNISIVLFDSQFNYLGETIIGTGREWNIRNSFVTKNGLYIEWIDLNDETESFLKFKIFNLK